MKTLNIFQQGNMCLRHWQNNFTVLKKHLKSLHMNICKVGGREGSTKKVAKSVKEPKRRKKNWEELSSHLKN